MPSSSRSWHIKKKIYHKSQDFREKTNSSSFQDPPHLSKRFDQGTYGYLKENGLARSASGFKRGITENTGKHACCRQLQWGNCDSVLNPKRPEIKLPLQFWYWSTARMRAKSHIWYCYSPPQKMAGSNTLLDNRVLCVKTMVLGAHSQPSGNEDFITWDHFQGYSLRSCGKPLPKVRNSPVVTPITRLPVTVGCTSRKHHCSFSELQSPSSVS